MSSEATHSRKSRLAVPTGNDETTASSNGAGAATSSSSSALPTRTSAVSGLPMSRRHHHHNTGGLGGGVGGFGALSSGSGLRPMHYFSRLTDVRQMDMQAALDQMKTLLSTRPQVVYKTSYYRKQTNNHWARDDPAFCALQAVFLLVSCAAYSVAFRCTLTGAISFMLYAVLWNWLAMGILLASACREIANRSLNNAGSSNSNGDSGGSGGAGAKHVRQQVEWLYAFDIHCNAFFPVFVVLYALQFFLLPVVLGEGLMQLILANTLYGAALSWYWYITHLGYRSLPFLSNTEVFLFPIAAVVLLYATMLIGYPFGFGWNMSRVMARFYFM